MGTRQIRLLTDEEWGQAKSEEGGRMGTGQMTKNGDEEWGQAKSVRSRIGLSIAAPTCEM